LTKREIILDTETTGLSRVEDRVVEIGCVEIVDLIRPERLPQYISPRVVRFTGRPSRFTAWATASWASKPTFRRIVDRFLRFNRRRDAGHP